jgi:hypothetical protein
MCQTGIIGGHGDVGTLARGQKKVGERRNIARKTQGVEGIHTPFQCPHIPTSPELATRAHSHHDD